MNIEAANNLTVYLAGLIPTMTETQKKEARNELLRFNDPETIKPFIRNYAINADRFTLGGFIRSMQVPQIERTSQYMEAQKAAAEIVAEKRRKVFAIVGAMDAQRLKYEKQKALEWIGGAIAKRKENADPKTDYFLASTIAELVEPAAIKD